jgi:glycosyltransferase involved in cell wall biosynthesis
MPKVSVVIPTYNRARFLPVAVRSVLKQTFTDFEIVIVDDASADDTEAVVASLGDARIKYIRHDRNMRIAHARNTGVANSTGEYIAFLDDDDEWVYDKLAKQVQVLDTHSPIVGAVYTAFAQVDLATESILGVVAPRKRGHILHELCMRNWIGTASTVCVRRECFAEVGLFDEGIEFGEEYDMWIRIAHAFDFEYIDEVLVAYGVHARRLTTNYAIVISGLEEQLRKHGRFFGTDSANYSRRYSSLGTLYCYNHEAKKGRRAFAQAIKASPLTLSNYVLLGLTLLGAKGFTTLREPRDGAR